MLWIVPLIFAVARATPIRICVSEPLAAPCAQMAEDLPEDVACVVAPDMFGCMEKVTSGEADVVNVDANGLYLAGKFFNLGPIVTELVDGETHKYKGIALVAKDSDILSANDLKGKRSCHTGYRRTVGWQIPMGKLLHEGIMEPSCAEGELAAANEFFGGSCVPGNWTRDPIVDSELKKKYPNLCSRCKDPSTCAQDDAYAGYEGVITCLKEGSGDVAFTKIPVLREYMQKNPDFTRKYEFLCWDGGRKDLSDPEPCAWGYRPTNAFVARSEDSAEQTEKWITTLLSIQTRYSVPQVRIPDWYYKSFLSSSKVSGIKRTDDDRRGYVAYLGEFIHTIIKPRPGCDEDHTIKFCVTSEEEHFKCQDYSKAAEARGMWPGVQCVKAASKAACMETLKEGNAHLLVLDGGDVYKAGRYFDLQPLAGELYNGSDATYYAVALLPSASDVTKIADLRGLRSCHTGIGRTAGWVMPVGVLLSEVPELASEDCNRATAVADFFSAGSCVPGANDTKYNPGRVRSDDLCKHCIGDEEGSNKCARDSKERFSGYAGALRCLAEGKGDVAFAKHTTIYDYTDGRSELHWTKDLLSSDFKLLCDGGGTAPVSEYLQCNLGKVPSHHVVTNLNGVTDERCLQLASLLADSSRYFSNDSTLYRLFLKRQQPDLLFKDSATGLRVTPFHTSYEQVLGDRFLEASRLTDPKECA